MSLYRRHQMLSRLVRYATVARLAFPVSFILFLFGFKFSSCEEWLLFSTAVVSLLSIWVHPRLSLTLSQFVNDVNSSDELLSRYHHDTVIGRREDMINELRSEIRCSYMIAADQAKRGHSVSAGYFIGQAKIAEDRLRHISY